MHDETLALHAGFDADPLTKAVAALDGAAGAAAMRGNSRQVAR